MIPPKFDANKFEYAPPENEAEKMLCDLFEKILGCGRVGVNDDFFALGGNSIKVMQLQNECADSGLTTKIIFTARTPKNIAEMLESADTEESYDILPDYPISQTQYGIFVECSANPDTTI